LAGEGHQEDEPEEEGEPVVLEKALQWCVRPMIEKYVIPAVITNR
jgi:hypothetical protein